VADASEEDKPTGNGGMSRGRGGRRLAESADSNLWNERIQKYPLFR
jgi:hypothetical protein